MRHFQAEGMSWTGASGWNGTEEWSVVGGRELGGRYGLQRTRVWRMPTHEARDPGGGSDTGGHQTFAMRSVSEPWFPGPLQMASPLSPRHSWPQGEAAQPAQSTHPHLLGHFSQRSRLSDERASPPRLPLPSRAEIGGRHLHARHQKRWPQKHPGNIDRVSE